MHPQDTTAPTAPVASPLDAWANAGTGPAAPPSAMHLAQLRASFYARTAGGHWVKGHSSTPSGRLAAAYDRGRLTPASIASALAIPVELRRGLA